jgi:hypothetical protein
MKTALLLSGQIRNAKESHASIQTHLIEKYQADVFVSTWKPASNIVGAIGYAVQDDCSIDEILHLYKPKEVCVEDFNSIPIVSAIQNLTLHNKTAYDGTFIDEVNFANLFFQYYKRLRGINLIAQYQTINSTQYDCVIVSRFDLTFDDFPYIEPQLGEIYIPVGPYHDSPMYHYGGLRDVMALGTIDAMMKYCNLFNHLPRYYDTDYGLHPESILRTHLEQNNLRVKRFPISSRLRNISVR